MNAHKYFNFLISFLIPCLFIIFVFVFSVVFFVPSAYASSPSLISAKITGSNTATLTFSEQVNTTTADYTNFTGSLLGRNLINVNGSGSTIISLIFDGNSFPANATGGLTIHSTLVGTFDNAPLPVTNSANSSQNIVSVTDGQAPVLSSIQISSNNQSVSLGSAGSSGTISFSTNEPINAPTIIVGGASIPVSGSGSGPYIGTFTINQNMTSSLSFSVTLTDLTGNTTQLTLSTEYSNLVNPLVNSSISILEKQPIGSVTTPTPSYLFSSDNTGKISYFGDCSSPISTAVVGVNSIPLNPLSAGTHSNCYITVSNTYGSSNLLAISPFTINITGQTPIQISAPSSSAGCVAGASFSTTTGAPCPQTSSQTQSSSSKLMFVSLLKVGSSGNEVTELQQKLKTLGFLTVTPNGYFGPATEAAVKKLQSAHGLSPVGQVGPATRALLNQL